MSPLSCFGVGGRAGQRRWTPIARGVLACVAVALCVLAGCDAAAPGGAGPRVAVERQAIIDGMRESGRESVVAIVARERSTVGLCTGSVIGPYHVMTAKHCVYNQSGDRMPASAFSVVVGDDLTRSGGIDSVSRVSEIRTVSGDDLDRDVRNGDDIAILLLSNRLSVPALPTATRAPSVGSEVTIIGFGRTMPGVPDPDDAGIKFIGTAEVTGIDTHLIQTEGESATCEGDSGGPLLDERGAVAGITSFGLDMECMSSLSLYTRVSRHAELIEDALRWSPSCPDAAPETCNGVDDNCDGVVDEVCRDIGDSCNANTECEGGLCARIDGRNQCTSACDPTEALPECSKGTTCRAMGCGIGRCVAAEDGATADGDACSAHSQCASGFCGSVEGMRLCARACRTPGGDSCPMGQVCDTSDGSGGCGSCVRVTLSRALRPFGAVCDSATQCESGMCMGAGMTGAFCTRACGALEPCGPGLHCRDATCVAGALGTPGTSCVSDMDCGMLAPRCTARDGDRVCAADCATDDTCGVGLECTASDDGARRCLRAGTALGLPCTQAAECTTGLCDGGRCARLCSASTPCPDGFECRSGTDAASDPLCQRLEPASSTAAADAGGCAVAAGARRLASWAQLAGWLLLAWVLQRRRRCPA